MDEKPVWKLIAVDDEGMILKKDGRVFCTYARSTKLGCTHLWHLYFVGFPKMEFMSREGCILNAQAMACDRSLIPETEST